MKKVKYITGKLITFDFDGTLEDDFDGTTNEQKNEVQEICRQLIVMGNDVRILTKRYSEDLAYLGKGMEHLEVYKMANVLGIEKSKIHFTNRQMKFDFICNNDVDIHFENSQYEVELIYKNIYSQNKNCTVVWVEDTFWRDLVY